MDSSTGTSTVVNFDLGPWTAFGQDLTNQKDWCAWAQANQPSISELKADPEVKFLPLMTRRRLGRLSKIVFWLCQDLGWQEVDQRSVIFSSRHGDSSEANTILKRIGEEGDVSPADFTTSVHNASSGLLSIHSRNHLSYQAIAAGARSFEMGLLEAISMSVTTSKPVVYLYVENDLNPIFQNYISERYPAHGLGMIVTAHLGGAFQLRAESNELQNSICPSLAFLRWFLTETSQLKLEGCLLVKNKI
jgi:hypothetical protein